LTLEVDGPGERATLLCRFYVIIFCGGFILDVGHGYLDGGGGIGTGLVNDVIMLRNKKDPTHVILVLHFLL
jgi:hypothetical protein